MHIPDGFLTGQAAAAGAVVGAAGLALCVRRAGREGRERDLPVAGLAAAFFIVGDAPMFPLSVGTDAHLLGGTLAVALLGPWLGAITIAVVAAIQALAFGDGGITTYGLNVVNLALVPAFVGYPLIMLLRRRLPVPLACGIAAFVSVMCGASLFVLDYALGAAHQIDVATVASTTLGAYAVVGLVEGALTAMIVRSLLGVRPGLVRVRRPSPAGGRRVSGDRSRAAGWSPSHQDAGLDAPRR